MSKILVKIGNRPVTTLEHLRKRQPNRALSEAEIRLLLNTIDNIHDDVLIRLGVSVGLRVSEIVTLSPPNIDFDRGVVRIWDEKKDKWRLVMPPQDVIARLRHYLNALEKTPKLLFPISKKTIERRIQHWSKKALGKPISWHSLRTTYVTRSVELEQSPAVVMANTGDSPATILKWYTKLPETVMRKMVEAKHVIPD